MSVGEAEAPKEMAKLRNFGASARAASLPAPPPRPLVVASPEPAQDAEEADASVPEVIAPVESVVLSVQPESVVSVPDDLWAALVASPRAAVVSTDPARRLSPKRQTGTYLADDALRTLQFMTYVEGCELWRLLDTAVRALAQARGVKVRPYTDEEIGKR